LQEEFAVILRVEIASTIGAVSYGPVVFGFGQVSAKPNKPHPGLDALQLITRVKSALMPSKCIGIKVAKAIR
jgi:hypothetical protein